MAREDKIPEHLATQVLGYALLMGADYNIVRAEEYNEDQIIIWYEYKGKTDWILRKNLNKNVNQVNPFKTQKIHCFGNTPTIQICQKPVNKIILDNINRADKLTPKNNETNVKPKIIYHLDYKDYKSTLPPKKVENIIDAEEIKVHNKRVEINETPDLIEKVYYEAFGVSHEKHVMEI